MGGEDEMGRKVSILRENGDMTTWSLQDPVQLSATPVLMF